MNRKMDTNKMVALAVSQLIIICKKGKRDGE